MADVDLDQAGELLVSQIRAVGGGRPVTLVAHSMGGTVLTRAAQTAPELVDHAVYLTAFMPGSDVPAIAYAQGPENTDQLAGPTFRAGPAVIALGPTTLTRDGNRVRGAGRSGTVTIVQTSMQTTDATDDDWPALWPILRAVAQAGDTFCWPRDVSEEAVRAEWMAPAPNLTLVLRDGSDVGSDIGSDVLGTSVLHPNQGGPGSHVANASFAVDPAQRGRGAGRRLAEDTLDRARAEGYRAMQFNAVVQTNTGAVRLWTSLGFRVLATVPEAFRHPTEGFVGLHLMYLML